MYLLLIIVCCSTYVHQSICRSQSSWTFMYNKNNNEAYNSAARLFCSVFCDCEQFILYTVLTGYLYLISDFHKHADPGGLDWPPIFIPSCLKLPSKVLDLPVWCFILHVHTCTTLVIHS